MAAVGDGEIVTKFLFSTCRLQPTQHDIRSVLESAALASKRSPDEPEAEYIPLLSGSSAELYIKPLFSCVDDIDIMFHRSIELAIPAGYPAPTQLPDEFHSRVMVFDIIDSEYPGYVYLKTRCLLTEGNHAGRYNAVLYDRQAYFSMTVPTHGGICRPAHTFSVHSAMPSHDRVHCVRCLSWPSQAGDWPTGHRKYGWLDSATVDRVVSNGCDLVHVAHRLCRHDEWENEYQWRLSFSRAEMLLLNTWLPVQQIVYHMLRFYAKSEQLTGVTDSTGTKIISNYDIKTLMLWACELKPGSWWTENTNVVTICVELLHTLAVWLADARCPQYFIRNCNLMDTAINQERIVDRLMPVTEPWLSTWFVSNYIRICAQLCPDTIARLFDSVSTNVKLHNAASAVVACRQNTALDDLLHVYQVAEAEILELVSCASGIVHSYIGAVNGLTKLDLRLSGYLTAVEFLHVAIKYTNHDIDIESMDLLSTLCGQSVDRRRYSSPLSSAMLLSQAVKLMKVIVNKSCSTLQLIEIELSKAYLYRALRCKDFDNDSIYCLANVYLAVLYYTTGQYQTAIDHCTSVTKSQDHSQCSSNTVQGEHLPKVDDDTDNVLGISVFYRYVRTTALNQQQQPQHVSVFTTELFAHYLLIRCISDTECHQLVRAESTNEIQYYRRNINDRQEPFIGDLLLFKMFHTSHNDQHPRPALNVTELNTSNPVELLQQCAVEHLKTFRQVMAREFGFVCTIVTTDFEAMYAYKRGDYQLCLQLCTQNVRTLLYARRLTVAHISSPVFIQLLDDDIVSLTAMTLIVSPECRQRSQYISISQLTLSLYLMTQCQLKLRHSVTQLSQTLDYIDHAQSVHPADCVLDNLTLQLTKRNAMWCLASALQ